MPQYVYHHRKSNFTHGNLVSGFPSLVDATIDELVGFLNAGSLTSVELVEVTLRHAWPDKVGSSDGMLRHISTELPR